MIDPGRVVGSILSGLALAAAMDFRLSLESGVPVSTTDQTAKTTLYLTPYCGNRIGLYNGSKWVLRETAELSISLAGLTSGLVYDVFVYDNAGTPTLELLAWTNATTRATALTRQNGILVKSGAATRRYAGSIVMSATGQSQIKFGGSAAGGSEAYIGIWNFYNQKDLKPFVRDTTDNWTYGTGTWRNSNNSAGMRVSMVRGFDEDWVRASFSEHMTNGAGSAGHVGVGLDGTTNIGSANEGVPNTSGAQATFANLLPGLGFHYLQALEFVAGSGNVTFYGDNGNQQNFGNGFGVDLKW